MKNWGKNKSEGSADPSDCLFSDDPSRNRDYRETVRGLVRETATRNWQFLDQCTGNTGRWRSGGDRQGSSA